MPKILNIKISKILVAYGSLSHNPQLPFLRNLGRRHCPLPGPSEDAAGVVPVTCVVTSHEQTHCTTNPLGTGRFSLGAFQFVLQTSLSFIRIKHNRDSNLCKHLRVELQARNRPTAPPILWALDIFLWVPFNPYFKLH